MKIGVIGAGRIGGNCARQAVKAGHEVMLSFARDQSKLDEIASELGDRASVGTAADAVAFGELVILSVPWGAVPEALAQAGDLSGKVVIDTTNQFGSGPMPVAGQTAASFNAGRMPGARYVKSFNTLTSRFQEQAATRDDGDRVVQWICGDDRDAKTIVAGLIEGMGYLPIDLGGTDYMRGDGGAPPSRSGVRRGVPRRRRPGGRRRRRLYGAPIPPTPHYD